MIDFKREEYKLSLKEPKWRRKPKFKHHGGRYWRKRMREVGRDFPLR